MTEIRRALRHVILIGTVVRIELDLSPFVTGIEPLAGSIRDNTGLGLQGMALLTPAPCC